MISNNYANNLLKQMTGNMYLGLCSEEPNSNTGAVSSEPTSSYYARVPLSSTDFTTNGGVITNSKELKFNTARESFGTMKYFFVASNSTRGSVANWWGRLLDASGQPADVTIGENTVPVFYEGDLRASIDVPLT